MAPQIRIEYPGAFHMAQAPQAGVSAARWRETQPDRATRKQSDRLCVAPRLTCLALLLCSALSCLPLAAVQTMPASDWSGVHAEVNPSASTRTPDGERAVSFAWTRPNGQTLATLGRSFPPVAMPGDVVVFWLRVNHNVERIQAILTDGDDVGAETGIAGLLNAASVEPGQWHYIVWPFRTNPGWVRYQRTQVDWQRIKGISLYTWPEHLPQALTVEVGPFQVLSYAELEGVFQDNPDRVRGNRAIPWRVLAGKRTDRMMPEYHQHRAEERIAKLRARYPPEQWIQCEEQIRNAVAASYLMPAAAETPTATRLRTVEVDGVRIEHQLLMLREGIYSPALVFLPPPSASNRHPAILMLPGHGDPSWSPSVQSRCLPFAKRGYLVMLVQPFGQAERGENPRWNESHDAQSTAYLLTTGESLLGLIMADHQAELTYLLSRGDVDPGRIAVTGVSMGGTHALWLSAIDPRLVACIPDAVAPEYQPNSSFRHHGLCDLMWGVYSVADLQTIQSLSAPRALMILHPGDNAPVNDEGMRRLNDGWISYDTAVKDYRMSPERLALHNGFTHQVYSLLKVSERFSNRVVAGPHDYTQTMRELAAGWLARQFDAAPGSDPIPEPAVTPIKDRLAAIETLNTWPKAERPADFLSPAAYVQKRTSQLISRLPPPSRRPAGWTKQREALRLSVRTLLGVDLSSPGLKLSRVGTARAESGRIDKLVVEPEPGIELPMLLFEADEGMRPDGRLVVLLHPSGMNATTRSEDRRGLTRQGAWVLCVDLRGMGETRYDQESGGYLGFRDLDTAMAPIKLGETLAGYWTKDLLAAIEGVHRFAKKKLEVTVKAELETALVALLAAGLSDVIQRVETQGMLASCYSPKGYGLPFAYSDENNSPAVRSRPLGGYGSMLPCIPNLLKHADIPQLAALVAPKPLTILEPRWPSGDVLSQAETLGAFAWTRHVYELTKTKGTLKFTGGVGARKPLHPAKQIRRGRRDDERGLVGDEPVRVERKLF